LKTASAPQVLDKFGRSLEVYADFEWAIASFGDFIEQTPHRAEHKMQKNVVYDYNNRVTSSDSWTAESGSSIGQWVTTQMEFDWNDDLTSGTDQYYEKTSLLSNASGLTNTTPNVVNATYTDSRGRKVGTITYGSTSADDIITKFKYNNIGELTEVVDPIGLSTFYTYDLVGRVLTEDHPDRGLTSTTYDPASNVIEIQTPGTQSFGGAITMDYHYNRLTHKFMPTSTGGDLYDIIYTYGTKNDGRNGAGRITEINQGAGFKIDLLKYDELGQVVEEATTLQVPMYGPRSFTTTKSYDSFGRIIQANYPDGDRVDYGYTNLGELYSIESTVSGTAQMMVSSILYNGYGQISRLDYGNGTYTEYDYDLTGTGVSTLKKNTLFQTLTTAKEQGASTQSTVLERNYTYNTQGMVTTLDRDVTGSLMNTTAGTTVSLSDQYNYDAFGRFDNHSHTIGGNAAYSLDMTYNKAGGITLKDANAGGVTNAAALDYTLNYTYSATNPHQLDNVVDSKSGIQSHYQYNSSGSIKEIVDPAAGGPQTFYWNEEQWLSGVSNDLGVHHYVYDHKGERVMKSSVMQSSVQVNDQNIDDVQYLDPYTLYINPYYVVTELQGGDKVSKHYYMNTQRVATDISINYQGPTPMAGPQQSNLPDPKKPSEDSASVNYNAAFADLQETLAQLGRPKLDVDHMGEQPSLEQYYPEFTQGQGGKSAVAAKNGAESITRVLFWYHPDYLGNVDLVTERDGKTYEFFTYNPWGEEMHQYNANTLGFSSPYRFNSKEKDEETGLHYYGARYYQSKLSLWMSVDPWAHETMQQYQFTNSNPIKYIDPDGRDVWEIDEKGNIVSHTIDKTKDAFYRVDASGNRLEGENNSIEFTYGTIKSQNSPNVRVIQKDGTFENRTLTLYDVNGDDNAKELFEFMANNNKVEFTHAKIGGKDSGRNIVGTSHNKSSTPVGQYLRKTGYTLREVNHNHPSDNPIPSGYPGDRSGAELYKKQFPNVKLHIYTVKHGYSEYDEKGTLDERILTGKI
jgi:RHS repeat-associated protein